MAEPQPDPGIVIVGAGQAGYQLANSLRDAGYQGALTLIGDEAELPYQRPPLSKAFLSGALGAEALTFQQQPHFDTRVIDLRTGLRVSQIDRAAQRVDLSDGDSLAYDRLVLASVTYNGDIFPCMHAYLHALTERSYQNRTVAFLENGTWTPTAGKTMAAMLEKSKNITFANEKVTIKSALNEASAESIHRLAAELAEK